MNAHREDELTALQGVTGAESPLPPELDSALIASRLKAVSRARRVMAQCNHVLVRAAEEVHLAQDMCSVVVGLGDFNMAWIGLVRDDDAKTIEPIASTGDEDGYLRTVIQSWAEDASGEGPAGQAVQTGRAQVVQDIRTDPKLVAWREEALARGHHSLAALPLICEGQTLGVIGICAGQTDAFQDAEMALFGELADDIAYGIFNLRLRALQRETAEALRVSERFSLATLDALSQHICVLDELGQVVAVNAMWRRFAEQNGGVSRGAMVGSNYLAVCDSAGEADAGDASAVARGVRAVMAGELDVFRHEYACHSPGEHRWFAVNVTRFPGSGPVQIVMAHENITERKLATQALQSSIEEFRTLTEAMPQIVWITRPDGWCTYFSRQWTSYTGLPLEEGSGHGWNKPFHPEDAPLAWQAWRQAVASTGTYQIEVRLRRADGAYRWWLARGVPVKDTEGRIVKWIGTWTDVHDLKVAKLEIAETNRELRESEARYRTLSELSADYYWDLDEQYRFTGIWSRPGIESVTPVEAYIGRTRWEMPQIVNVSEEAWNAHRAVLDARKPFRDFILWQRDAYGKPVCFSVSGHPVFEGGGAFRGYRGVSRDITELKRDETLRTLEHAVNRCLADAPDSASALVSVMRVVCRTEQWECGRYLRVDEGAGLLRAEQCWWIADAFAEGFVQAYRNVTYAPGEGLAGRAWQSGGPVWSSDIKNDMRVANPDLVESGEMRGVLMFPMLNAGRVLGVLAFNSRQIREPEPALLKALAVIGNQIGQFLQRRTAEDALRRHAHRERLLTELSRVALAEPDASMLMNRALAMLCNALGFEFGKVLQLSPDGEKFILRTAVGWPADKLGRQIMPSNIPSQASYAIALGEPVLVPDFSKESRFVISPLAGEQNIVCGIEAVIPGRDGPYGVLGVHSRLKKELSDTDAVFLQSAANLLAAALQRKDAEQQLAHVAQFDALTGLPNRTLFRDRLVQTITQSKRGDWSAAMLYVNLDAFKLVNDTYGHEAGDLLLMEISQRLAGCVRAGDTVARLNGDEFGIILSNLARPDDASLVAEKIVQSLGQAFTCSGEEVFIAASTGIALYPGDSDGADGLIKNAAVAMYRAKEMGRNHYLFYTAQLNLRTEKRLRLEGWLRHALERGEFQLHYQPKVDLATGRIAGAEALLRWNHPERGMVSPAEFIPVLEDTGMILPVGLWVLRTACEQMRDWRDAGLPMPSIAVNLSARQFQQADLAERVAEIIALAGVDPGQIELELTESMLMSDPDKAVAALQTLKGLGIRLSVDDFGTGYSSLAYLKRFPLDTLKIDRAFVREVSANPDDAAIALAVIKLAHSLGLKVVAEGVESEPQLHFLARHGCDQLQGFLFSRPVDAQSFGRMIAEGKNLEIPAITQNSVPTLLLLDDSDNDLLLLATVLEKEGYRLLTASSVTGAFEILAGRDVDVVISDQNMPGMSGVAFLSRVREIYPGTGRVMMSGANDPKNISDAINAAGIHKFILKDWSADRVRSAVRDAYQEACAG